MRTPPPSPLRQLRLEAQLTLDTLAFATGIDASTLSRAERGYRRLPPDKYVRAERICAEALTAAAGSHASGAPRAD